MKYHDMNGSGRGLMKALFVNFPGGAHQASENLRGAEVRAQIRTQHSEYEYEALQLPQPARLKQFGG
jgi:hypothetical protein